MRKKILFVLVFLVLAGSVWARPSSYTFFQTWRLIEEKYVKEIPDSVYQIKEEITEYFKKEKNLTEEALYGKIDRLVNALGDKHSWFMNPEESEFFSKEEAGIYVGIGCHVKEDGKARFILAPFPASPAEKAGIKEGDELVRIDGKDIRGASIKELYFLFYGEEGSFVNITVVRDGKTLEFKPKRARMATSSVVSQVRADSIAVIKIYEFGPQTSAEFEKEVEKILAFPVKGLILDLRDNPGGLLSVVVDISGFWFRGTVAYKKTKTKREEVNNSLGKTPLGQIETVVLINKRSASGAEALALALQDWGLARLVGQRSAGKGTIQEALQVQGDVYCYREGEFKKIQERCLLRLTIGFWTGPKGKCVDEIGIVPDIIIEDDPNTDNQLKKAIELFKQEK